VKRKGAKTAVGGAPPEESGTNYRKETTLYQREESKDLEIKTKVGFRVEVRS